MKKIQFSILLFLSILAAITIYSCNKDDIKINNSNEQLEIRLSQKRAQQFEAMFADIGGGWSGVKAGAFVGTLFGSPAGGILGGMVGGVIGCVGASYINLRANGLRTVAFPSNEIPFAPTNFNTYNNEYDIYGRLHNKLLNKAIAENIDINNYSTYINLIRQGMIEENLLNDVQAFNNITPPFQSHFYSIMDNINDVSQSGLLQRIKNTTFENDQQLENFVANELINANITIEDKFALAIMRHSYYFHTHE